MLLARMSPVLQMLPDGEPLVVSGRFGSPEGWVVHATLFAAERWLGAGE
jgi:hypothetical protein